jgi:hypothetical protein
MSSTTSFPTTLSVPAPTHAIPTTFPAQMLTYPTVAEEEMATLMPFPGLCDRKTCGEHGECEVVNTTHVVCSCRDYYTGPSCDNCEFIGGIKFDKYQMISTNLVKPIGYAARFQGNAFMVFSADDFPHLTSEREETIELRLKTSARYGVSWTYSYYSF